MKTKAKCVMSVVWLSIGISRKWSIEPRYAKRALWSKCLFSFFRRYISENLSIIYVKISFLWGCEHVVYAAVSFVVNVTSCYLRNNFKQLLLFICTYMNLYLFLGDYLVLILKFYTIPVCLQDVIKLFKPKPLSSKNVSIFTTKIWLHFSIRAMLINCT